MPELTLEAVLRWPGPDARHWVEALLGWARRSGRLEAVVAVGSSVRPGIPSNDLDLVLVHGDDRPDFPAPPHGVELTLFAAAEVEEKIRGGDDLLGWALRFGKGLWERDGYWKALCEQWAGRLLLPSAQVAADRAAAAGRRLAVLRASGPERAVAAELGVLLVQEARCRLLRAGMVPLSRPELPEQLQSIGQAALARCLVEASDGRGKPGDILQALGLELPATTWTPG